MSAFVYSFNRKKRIDTTEHECKYTYLFAWYMFQWVFKQTNADTITILRQNRTTKLKSQQKAVKPSHFAAWGMHNTCNIFFMESESHVTQLTCTLIFPSEVWV